MPRTSHSRVGSSNANQTASYSRLPGNPELRLAMSMGEHTYVFGQFALHAGGELQRDGRPVELGNRALRILEVLVAAGGRVVTKEKTDYMHSFLFAETFKYFYLLFAPDKTLDLSKIVFNTEAHPIRKTWKN